MESDFPAAPVQCLPPLPQVAEAMREMVHGVRQYFNQGLRHFLLYSHELLQADEALGGGSSHGTATPPKQGVRGRHCLMASRQWKQQGAGGEWL